MGLQVPPWMEAVDRHYQALKVMEEASDTHGAFPHTLRSFSTDLEHLRKAETYAWYGPALEAVQQAALSVRPDAPLNFDQLPKGSKTGFFWFTPPLRYKTSNFPDTLNGLLWGVMEPEATVNGEPPMWHASWHGHAVRGVHLTLHFSAYTVANRPEADPLRGRPMPSTEFFWRNGDSLDDMLAFGGKNYDAAYGPSGLWQSSKGRNPFGGPLLSRETTLNTVREIGQFFLASIVWLGQDILQTTPAHIERHRRKQIMREHKLKEPPTVKVIALRHVHYQHEGEDADALVRPGNTTLGNGWWTGTFGTSDADPR